MSAPMKLYKARVPLIAKAVVERLVSERDIEVSPESRLEAEQDLVAIMETFLRRDIELRDETVVRPMRVREVRDVTERSRLWGLAVAAYPAYADYQKRTERQIPVFVAEPR